ncbi:hypothetical protein MKW94_030083 [Papaver nudicaule]|uniref:Pentatricopeptide repeat-containing protein n=1 Tax=Papaver nudicaule TaxID=74823 RepID=A0AA41VG85_PAPNU|nr:hypothetical protein [Papaver nudicaule]
MYRAMISQLNKSISMRIASNMAATVSNSTSQCFLLRNSNTRMEVDWIAQCCGSCYSTMVQPWRQKLSTQKEMKPSAQVQIDNPAMQELSRDNLSVIRKREMGETVSGKDKVKFLMNTLVDLEDCKETIYSALDAWVAPEQKFPTVSLKRALIVLEKENQWHRVIQVIKWMLSKGQGTTMGTYGQLICALDKDHRPEEAHIIWSRKVGNNMHSAPKELCDLMISIYYQNNMFERLVKLFKRLEAYNRKPPGKSLVQKVADAYQRLGLPEEQKLVLEKYTYLFIEKGEEHPRKSKKATRKEVDKAVGKETTKSKELENAQGS